LHLIVAPELSGGWQHNHSIKIRQLGCANEQSIYSLMSMVIRNTNNYYPAFKGRFVEKIRNFAASLGCGKVYYYVCYELGHTLFSCLSATNMLIKPTSKTTLLNKIPALSCSFRCEQS
jgi:hypothetical protein